jgi:hypothetical protein
MEFLRRLPLPASWTKITMATKMNGTKREQEKAIRYYDKISNIYDYISN